MLEKTKSQEFAQIRATNGRVEEPPPPSCWMLAWISSEAFLTSHTSSLCWLTFPSMKNVTLKAAMVSFVPLSCSSVSQTRKKGNIKNEKVIVTGTKKIKQSYSPWLSGNLLINLLLKGKFDSSPLDHRQELDSLGPFHGRVAAVCVSNILQGNY